MLVTIFKIEKASSITADHISNCIFCFEIAQYNSDTHNARTLTPLWTHVRKPYPYERLRRLSRQILKINEVTTVYEVAIYWSSDVQFSSASQELSSSYHCTIHTWRDKSCKMVHPLTIHLPKTMGFLPFWTWIFLPLKYTCLILSGLAYGDTGCGCHHTAGPALDQCRSSETWLLSTGVVSSFDGPMATVLSRLLFFL